MTDLLPYVLRAARLGWPVFPLIPGGKTPAIRAAHLAGHPCRGECGRAGHGFHDATTDEAIITAWWTRWPRANYGISTGPAGLVVIDLDTAKARPAGGRVLPDQGPDEPAPADIGSGVDVLTWAARRDNADPSWLNTFTVATPSGGWHLYYAAPAGKDGSPVRGSVGVTGGRITGLGWCIDVRSAGGYVVGPGSAGPAFRVATSSRSGPGRADCGYRVAGSGPLAELPGWLAARISRTGTTGTPPCTTTGAGGRAGRGRHQAARGRVRPGYLDAAIAGEVAAIEAANPGGEGGTGRNATVNRAAYKLGRLAAAFALADDELAAPLLAAALKAGLSEREAATAIASGLAQGRANPRTLTRSGGLVKGRP